MINAEHLGLHAKAHYVIRGGEVAAAGEIIAYSDRPQVLIEEPGGQRVWWLAGLCTLVPPDESDEQLLARLLGGGGTVQVRGADRVAQLLTRPMVQAVEVGLTAVALEVQNELAPYPGQSGKAQGFKSDKSRRFFFAALRKGKITVPYRRSGDLGRSWTIRKVGSMRVALINTQSYAGLVHNVTNQSHYHKGNWTTDKTAADRVRPRVRGIMEAAIKAALRG